MSETKQIAVIDTVRKMEPEFAALLRTSGTDIKKFMNNALMAINDKPEVKSGEVSTRSVFSVCSRAANDGVVLDGKEAAMVIGWNGKLKQKEAQYRLMAAGVMKMIRRSPDISFIASQVVYENDICDISFVTDDIPVKHTVNLKMGRGEPIGAYVVAKLASGEWTSPEYMSKGEIDAVRDNYSQKDKEGNFSKMWVNSWGEAARKTVLHRSRKRLPLSEGAETALRQDEDDEFSMDSIENGTGEVSTEKKRQTRAAKAVKEASTVTSAAGEPAAGSDASQDPGNVVDAEFSTEEASTQSATVGDDEPPM
jgi:recombination protein RecT